MFIPCNSKELQITQLWFSIAQKQLPIQQTENQIRSVRGDREERPRKEEERGETKEEDPRMSLKIKSRGQEMPSEKKAQQTLAVGDEPRTPWWRSLDVSEVLVHPQLFFFLWSLILMPGKNSSCRSSLKQSSTVTSALPQLKGKGRARLNPVPVRGHSRVHSRTNGSLQTQRWEPLSKFSYYEASLRV